MGMHAASSRPSKKLLSGVTTAALVAGAAATSLFVAPQFASATVVTKTFNYDCTVDLGGGFVVNPPQVVVRASAPNEFNSTGEDGAAWALDVSIPMGQAGAVWAAQTGAKTLKGLTADAASLLVEVQPTFNGLPLSPYSGPSTITGLGAIGSDIPGSNWTISAQGGLAEAISIQKPAGANYIKYYAPTFSLSGTALTADGKELPITAGCTPAAGQLLYDVPIRTTSSNATPTAGNVSAKTKGAPVSIQLAGADADGNQLRYILRSAAHGSLKLDGTKAVYTPDAGYLGTDTFTYVVDDGGAAAVGTVTVETVKNTPPTAGTVAVETEYQTAASVKLVGADADSDPLTYTTTAPAHGTISGTAPNLTYTPNNGYEGADTFSYTVNDGTDKATGTVKLTVLPKPNTPPTAAAVSIETEYGTAKAITLKGADADGDALTYSTSGGPANGTLSGSGANLTYTPKSGYEGSDSFTYTVNDGKDQASAKVSITVLPKPNTPPTAAAVSIETEYGTAKAITLKGADADGDALTYSTSGGPANGTLSGSGANLTYTPKSGFSGTDSFTYTVNDGEDQASAKVSITVLPKPNTAPTAGNVSVDTAFGTAKAITLKGADADGDALTYTVGTPSKGKLSGSGANLTYTPNSGATGTDSFSYTVSDGKASASGTVTVTIGAAPTTPAPTTPAPTTPAPTTPAPTTPAPTTPAPTTAPPTTPAPNRAPDARSVIVTTDAGKSVAVLLNAVDADGDKLTYTVASPANGKVTGTAPNLTYTPKAGFAGTDTFNYTVSDGKGGQDTATVTVQVNGEKPSRYCFYLTFWIWKIPICF